MEDTNPFFISLDPNPRSKGSGSANLLFLIANSSIYLIIAISVLLVRVRLYLSAILFACGFFAASHTVPTVLTVYTVVSVLNCTYEVSLQSVIVSLLATGVGF